MASARASRDDKMRSRRTFSLAQRWEIGVFDQFACAARARTTTSGNSDGGVFSKQPRTSPVAGLMDGIVPTEMAVAAIRGF